MQNELDVNAVVADASAQLAKDFLVSVIDRLSGTLKFGYETVFTDFQTHLAEVHQKISKVKIIISKDVPIDFKKIFVPSDYLCADRTYSSVDVIKTVTSGNRCVISGNGGAGKTFMMKNIWLEMFDVGGEKIPMLVELRKLNSLSTYDIESFIRVNAFGTKPLSERAFEHFCNHGFFVFLLDGFDEVAREKRDDLEAQIINLSTKYKSCGLIVSGRPDERFAAWTDFQTFRAAPLSYLQFRSLIYKVPFDLETKKSFLAVAKENFFKQHQSFLSNPLLALMMLLTFRDNAEIPSRLSSFYENCFATLYGQHDALKEAFNRKKALDQLQFKRLFSAFSLLSYRKNRTSMDGAEFLEFIQAAKMLCNVEVSDAEIEHDFLESVNLIVKDGLQYTFIHRSFQEFFSSYCLTSVLADHQEEVLSMFAKRKYDSTLRLTYELHPRLVEDKLVIPRFLQLKRHGLPRKSSRELPLSAVHKSGLTIRTAVRRVASRKLQRPTLFLDAFSVSWSKEYEELIAGIAIASDVLLPRLTFESDMVDLLIGGVWEPLSPKDRRGVLDFPSHEFLNVGISFLEDTAIVSGQEEEEEDFIDFCSSVQQKCNLIGPQLEKITIENNKNLFSGAQRVMSAKNQSHTVLGAFEF